MKNRLASLLASRQLIVPVFAIVFASVAASVSAEDATNVTSVVTALVKDNQVSINASNETFGDTAPGISKKLRVEYRIGDEKLNREVNEGGKIEIAAPAGQKLVITKAIYGPKISPMPVGLLNTFTMEEILDLLAYLESLGDPKHPSFAK